MYCRQLLMHQLKPSRWRKVKSRELQCWQRKKNRYEPIYWYFILYYMHFTRADLGVGRRGPGLPFFFEIFYSSFIEFSDKYKVFIYSWQVENGPGHPFLIFLDPPLLQILEWPLKWWSTLFYMATSMKEFNKSAFGKLNVTLKFSEWVCNSQREGWK